MSHVRIRIGTLVAIVATVGLLGAGCSVVSKVRQAVHNVESNKATIDSFTQNLQSNQSSPFQATYTTTGSAPPPSSTPSIRHRVASPSTRRRRAPTRPTSS